MLVGIVQATMVLLVAQLWFRIPFAGSFVILYVGISLFVLAAIGMGLLLSSFATTMQQAMLFSFLLIMPFTILSGLATPISSMPDSRSVPHLHQSVALRHQHCSSGVLGRRRTPLVMARALAPRDHRSRHSADSLLALSPPIDLKRIDNEKRQLPTLMMAISRFALVEPRGDQNHHSETTRHEDCRFS